MSFSIITDVLGLLLKLVSFYFLVIFAFAVKKPKKFGRAAPRHKFAILLPARNEAAVIGQTVRTLRRQNYPAHLYDIFVIPNNCTDNTALAARTAGAKVFTCARPVTCKGDALNEAAATLLKSRGNYDVFCVFDADNEVDSGFLAEMNRVFCSGARAAKGRTEARNPCDSWVSGCYALYFNTFNLLYNRGRAALGLSAKLIGTAFAVHRSLLSETYGFGTRTIAEDAEFAASLAAQGEQVVWAPNAVAYDEEPLGFMQSLKQRRRWCSGILQVSKKKLPEVLRALFNKKGRFMLKADSAMFLATPIIPSVSFLLAVSGIAGALASQNAPYFFAQTAAVLICAYAGTALYAASVALAAGGYDRRIVKSVLAFPLFMASFFPLQLLATVKETKNWEIIPHTGRKTPAKAALEQL